MAPLEEERQQKADNCELAPEGITLGPVVLVFNPAEIEPKNVSTLNFRVTTELSLF
jgi:hypothetical protein